MKAANQTTKRRRPQPSRAKTEDFNHGWTPINTDFVLGIESGATRTVALAVPARNEPPSNPIRKFLRVETGPANLRLVNDAQLRRHLQEIARSMPNPVSTAIGMAGARSDGDWDRIRRAAAKIWPGVPCYATNDLETALMAGEESGNEKPSAKKGSGSTARILVLSGTGSCCFGKLPSGKTAKVGGWGHLLGDKGSGYEIGLRALKAVVYYYDRDGRWSSLGQRILRALQLNEPDDLIGWVQSAGKNDVAALAVEVFNAARTRDKIAVDILSGAASRLASDATACAKRLTNKGPVQFILAGSVLLKQPAFARQVTAELRKRWPKAPITPLKRESVWGAVELARHQANQGAHRTGQKPLQSHAPHAAIRVRTPGPDPQEEITHSLVLSPTEQRNPLSMNLDKLPLEEAIMLMLREDANIPAALVQEREKIERLIETVVRAFRRGGRLFYVGAGTSGRLGILDASECPPTFRTPPEMVQGIIAGGQRAIWEAVEGAEDDPAGGARAIEFRGVGAKDVVVGIAASGRTPFVWGALMEAKRRGATTVLLCFNPGVQISAERRPDLIIAPNIGPEILTGSTRLKAGTTTKLILNMVTTLAMVRMGKVISNLMIDVKASNTKLRDRATRIVQELTKVDYTSARQALEKTGWRIKEACEKVGLKRGGA